MTSPRIAYKSTETESSPQKLQLVVIKSHERDRKEQKSYYRKELIYFYTRQNYIGLTHNKRMEPQNVCVLTILLAVLSIPADCMYLKRFDGNFLPFHKRSKLDTLEPKLSFQEVPEPAMKAFEGESLTITCQAKGVPPPTIHWLKNGKRINQGFTNQISDDANSFEEVRGSLQLSNTRSSLYLDCVTPRDVGKYQCVAETPTKREAASVKVSVVPSRSRKLYKRCKNSKKFSKGSKAKIYMSTVVRFESIGSDVQLFCRAQGASPVYVNWYKETMDPDTYETSWELINIDQTTDSGKPKYEVLDNGDLLVRDVNFESYITTQFKCEAKNKYGKDTTEMMLYATTET